MIEPIARVRIELREIEPTLWRRVDVPLTSTLLVLHDIIQVKHRIRRAPDRCPRGGPRRAQEPIRQVCSAARAICRFLRSRLGDRVPDGM